MFVCVCVCVCVCVSVCVFDHDLHSTESSVTCSNDSPHTLTQSERNNLNCHDVSESVIYNTEIAYGDELIFADQGNVSFQENVSPLIPKDIRPNRIVQNNKPLGSDSSSHPKSIPGNSLYSTRAKSGKKVCILADSICKGVKMKELNQYILNGYAYRKTFEGATSNELAHYSVLTLIKDKPDIVIINIGANDLYEMEANHIYENIMKIVDLCKSYGVNEIFVSGLIFRQSHQQKVSEVNNFLFLNQVANDYIYIDNEKIGMEHLWNDKIHLNKTGTIILANNFINILNDNVTK